MKDMSPDRAVYESLLYIYFSRYREVLLSEKAIKCVGDFIDLYRAKDLLDNTRTVETLETIYGSGSEKTKADVKTDVLLSSASLYRFRMKALELLGKYLTDNMN